MFVGPLKSNSQFSLVFLSVLCIGFSIISMTLINSQESRIICPENILYHVFFQNPTSSWLQYLLSFLTVFSGAFLVNFLSINQEISSKNNFLPAFLYILLCFSSKSVFSLEPILLANVFVLLSIYFLLNSYRQEIALSEFFKAGLFMALASFFYIDYIYLFPLCVIALLILRPFNWREWSIMLIGLLTPLYLFLAISYLTNNHMQDELTFMLHSISNPKKPIISEYYLALLFVLFLLVGFSLFNYLNKGFGTKIKTQKTKYILIWMLGLSVWITLFGSSAESLLLPCSIPVSLIVGDYLSEIKQLKIANTLLILFIGGFTLVFLHLLGVY